MNIFNTDFEKKEIYRKIKKNISKAIDNTEVLYIFVLAGGLKKNGKNHLFVEKRLDMAIDIYKSTNKECYIICIGGGTYHKPPYLNNNKYVIHESSSCAQYLYANGIPEKNIYREWGSYDTIANGFFSYTNFFVPLKIDDIILITSEFHMDRAKEIFNYFINFLDYPINIKYIATPNKGIDDNTLKERRKREELSLNNFKMNIVQKIKSIDEFTKWLYTEHNAYKSIIKYKKLDNTLASTY